LTMNRVRVLAGLIPRGVFVDVEEVCVCVCVLCVCVCVCVRFGFMEWLAALVCLLVYLFACWMIL